jgi:maltoporin
VEPRSARIQPTEPDSTVGRPTGTGIAEDPESAETWRLVGYLVYETQRWAMMGVVILEDRDHEALGVSIAGGTLGKLTLVAEWAPERRFFSRPDLRAYVTQAAWSDDFRGFVGGSECADTTSDWGVGIAAVSWW